MSSKMARVWNLIIGFGFMVGIFVGHGDASVIKIDGKVSDWGINPVLKQWIPGSSSVVPTLPGDPITGQVVYSGETMFYWVEDAVGPKGAVEPGAGGQAYDVEAMYLCVSDGNLYVGLVTGYNLMGNTDYPAGDLFLDISDGVSSTLYGFVFRPRIGFEAGGLYIAGDLESVVIPAHRQKSDPYRMISGQKIGGADYYAGLSEYNNHYLLEVAIPIALVGDVFGKKITARWTMQCGNDYGKIEGNPVVPEPQTAAMFFLGIMGMLGRRRRKK